MEAYTARKNRASLSKPDYIKWYLSAEDDSKKSKGKIRKKRRKAPFASGLKIVDDDIDWRQIVKEQEEVEDDEEEEPVIAEVIDDRPEEVKRLEAFQSGRWKVIGADENEDERKDPSSPEASSRADHDSPRKTNTSSLNRKNRHDSPDASPPRRKRHDSPDASPPRRKRHDSPDASPPRRKRHDSPDASPPRRKRHDSPDASPPRRKRHDSPDASLPRRKRHDSPDASPPRRKRHDSPDASLPRRKRHDSPDASPPRRKRHDSPDASPPRRRRHGSPDRSSPKKSKDSSLTRKQSSSSSKKRSPDPRRSLPTKRPQNRQDSDTQSQRMLSGGKAGLVSADILKKEHEENRRREGGNRRLEDESRNTETVFRDKSGKRRNLDSEREEQKKKAEEKAVRDQKYAEWGKGLAQKQMHQDKLEYALAESQKPLARNCDDEDLDRMRREQLRDGDPMAALLRRKKERSTKTDKPQYKGPPPPPNRFNIPPGYRWDGVDRSNGFEQKRYMRISDKKAVQEAAYKWSVEDM